MANCIPQNYIAKTALAASLLLAGCGGGSGGGSNPPINAKLEVSPNPTMVLEEVLLDASASDAGSGSKYSFDTNGDGIDDITSSSPVTRHMFGSAGDYDISLRIQRGHENPTAKMRVKVGFGVQYDSSAAFGRFARAVLEGIGYRCTERQQVQLFDPVAMAMVGFSVLEAEKDGRVLYTAYEPDLTDVQRRCADNRKSEGIYEPPLNIFGRRESPDTIKDVLIKASDAAKPLKALPCSDG